MTKTVRTFLLGAAATIGYALVVPAYAGDTAPLKVKWNSPRPRLRPMRWK